MVTSRVTPATFHGQTLTTTQSDNQVRQVITRLNMIYPNRTKLLAVTNQFAQVSDGKAVKLEWGEQADAPRFVEVVGTTAANGTAVGAAITTLFITPAAAVVAGETLRDDRTGEVFRVTSNTAGALVVGTRGAFGYTSVPVALPSGTYLRIMGAAKAEADSSSDPKSIIPSFNYNYYQTFERDISTSTLAKAIEIYLTRGGDLRNNDQINAMDDFKYGIENQLFFGQRSTSLDASSRAIYTLGGLEYWVNQVNNFHDINGAFTYPNFDAIMTDHARVGGGGLYYMFVPSVIGNIMRRWALDYQRSDWMQPGTTKQFGLDYVKFFGANYQVMLMQTEVLEESDTTVQEAFVVKAGNLKVHWMRGLGPTTNKGIQSPEKDGSHFYKDQITGCATVEVPLPEANCIFRGIQS